MRNETDGKGAAPPVIASPQNPWIRRCRALSQKKYRQIYREFVAEGVRFVSEALTAGAARAVLVDEARRELLSQLPLDGSTPCFLLRRGLLEQALPTVHSQGVAAVASQPDWDWQAVSGMRQLLILDGVRDPGNLGTLVRTALASDTDAVLCLKGTVDLYNDKALRATMGAVFRMPVYGIPDAEAMQQELRRWGFQLVVADVRAERLYHQIRFPDKTALVVSNEAGGPQQIPEGDIRVKIPLYRQAESLNVAVAAGILLYAIRTGREQA